ncbi:MAG: hypothetical protein EZS28_002009 [Streblomastix strix]|uniref:Tyr recombinase domain-containing protein n=1 Tax=Streblomastix strix TaxID=222440 RepID=A0A5J4X733_9EUKA|nr:MAG: hypothetical protein EZS28_002009 [Streblomastix strix]
MNILITKDRRHQLIEYVKQFIKKTYRHTIIKIKETATLIGRLNFLRARFKQASLCLMLQDSAKTKVIKVQYWTGMMVSLLKTLKELYQLIKKIAENKKIINIKLEYTINSSNRCLSPRMRSNTRTRLRRGSSSTRSMVKLPDTLDKQQKRTASHSLKNFNFRKSLRRAADNQYPNQIRQIYCSIRFKKIKSIINFSTNSEGDIFYLPTIEYEINNIACSGKDQYNYKFTQQIVQIRSLSTSSNLPGSNKNDMEYLTNFRSDRIINNKIITSIRYNEHKGLTSPMDRCILRHTDERNPTSILSNPNIVKSNFISQQQGDFSNSNSTMVAGPAMVYKFNESVKQVLYPWTVKPMPNQETKHKKPQKNFPPGKIAAFLMDQKWKKEESSQFSRQIKQEFFRVVQQLLINGWRFEIQRHYLYAMRTLAEFTYDHGLSIDQLLSISPRFLLLEVINWFTRWNPSVSSVNTLQSCLKTILSLTFDTPQITSTPSQFAYRAVLNCKIINKKYYNIWVIRQLLDYWRSLPYDKDISNIEIQTKLASLLLSLCFIRINEAAEINLAISNIDYRNQTVIFCSSSKTNNLIEQQEIRRTGYPKVQPNSTLDTQHNGLYLHDRMNSEHFANQFWQLDGQLADKRRSSLWLNSHLHEIDISEATEYSFKHVASMELARQELETTKLNNFTHLCVFSRAASNYYIHSANAAIDDIASQLVGSHGQSDATQTISQQRGRAIERSDINTLPECYWQHFDNSTLLWSLIVQPLALPFYETLPVGGGIEPNDSMRARRDMIYIDQYDNDDMSRQQGYRCSWNDNRLEHRRCFYKDNQQQ